MGSDHRKVEGQCVFSFPVFPELTDKALKCCGALLEESLASLSKRSYRKGNAEKRNLVQRFVLCRASCLPTFITVLLVYSQQIEHKFLV